MGSMQNIHKNHLILQMMAIETLNWYNVRIFKHNNKFPHQTSSFIFFSSNTLLSDAFASLASRNDISKD